MKTLFLIPFLIFIEFASGQVSFYDVYGDVVREHDTYLKEQKSIDSLKDKSFMQREVMQTSLTTRHLAEQENCLENC